MITALIVLIMLSAFFSASETAYSSLNMIRLKSRAEDGDKQAAKVLALAERYDSLLSTILIGNNIENIGASSLATVLFSRLLGNAYGPTASTIVMTLLVLTFGEIPQIKLLYNPGMQSAYNFVPGVMGLILMLICAMMTSISIVREKETGTMEVLLVSPVRPLWMIIAKMVPYFVLSCVNLVTILLLSVYVLHVPVAGSLFSLALLSWIFIVVSLLLGLLVSTIARTQVEAMLFSGMVLMMPTVLLSGMIFHIENMPLPLQLISNVIPARWYIVGIKKIMIEGLGISYAQREMGILMLMAVVLLIISLKKFNKRLE